jgi:Na+/proline symporter
MEMIWLDWLWLIGFFLAALGIGLASARRSSKSLSEYFLSGRRMPWWLLGMSMVATTFAADTPLLVTDFTRQGGVANNWRWIALLLTAMLTTFVYARLWRRLGIMTTAEFYEMRYSGKTATFLRGFRAVYMGLLMNVLFMANVTLAAIKIANIIFGWDPVTTIIIAGLATVPFCAAGGLRAVIWTDMLLFLVSMAGALLAMGWVLQMEQVGGLSGMVSHEAVQQKLAFFPEPGTDLFWSSLVIPFAVLWWATFYPGAEPGGGGFVVQRMLSARSERHATGATLFFNAAHYAIRPWPWIIVALASLIVFPSVEALERAFPSMPEGKLGHDMAYPAMLTFLPGGLLGLVVTSLAASYMSTISTFLNWGSSYLVNDLWLRFCRPDASTREQVWMGRGSTVLLMVLAGVVALFLENAAQVFHLIILAGAGTGLVYLLRWFWWRVNALSELVGLVVATVGAVTIFIYAQYAQDDPELMNFPRWAQFLTNALVTTVAWVMTALLSPQVDESKLRRFYEQVRPGGPGWRKVRRRAAAEGQPLPEETSWTVPLGLACTFIGCIGIYALLAAMGYFLYNRHAWDLTRGVIATLIAAGAAGFIAWSWQRIAGRGEAESETYRRSMDEP